MYKFLVVFSIIKQSSLHLWAPCLVIEIIALFLWQVSKAITTQGRAVLAAQGAIIDRTRLFHLCASKMAHTRGRVALRREDDKTVIVSCFMRGDRWEQETPGVDHVFFLVHCKTLRSALYVMEGIALYSYIFFSRYVDRQRKKEIVWAQKHLTSFQHCRHFYTGSINIHLLTSANLSCGFPVYTKRCFQSSNSWGSNNRCVQFNTWAASGKSVLIYYKADFWSWLKAGR